VGVVPINIVGFGSLLFGVTKNFRNFQSKKMMRRLFRGSLSRGSKERKMRRRRSPSIIFLVPRRFGRVSGHVMHSYRQLEFMMISIIWLGMQASPTSSSTSVISRSSLTSGTPRILLSTPERATLIHGCRSGQKPKLGGVRISHRHYIHVHTLISVVGVHTFSLYYPC